MTYDVTGGHSNTRPPNTCTYALRSLVDWVSATLDLPLTFDEFKHLFGFEKLPFEYAIRYWNGQRFSKGTFLSFLRNKALLEMKRA